MRTSLWVSLPHRTIDEHGGSGTGEVLVEGRKDVEPEVEAEREWWTEGDEGQG